MLRASRPSHPSGIRVTIKWLGRRGAAADLLHRATGFESVKYLDERRGGLLGLLQGWRRKSYPRSRRKRAHARFVASGHLLGG
jgi:hypothetical protein